MTGVDALEAPCLRPSDWVYQDELITHDASRVPVIEYGHDASEVESIGASANSANLWHARHRPWPFWDRFRKMPTVIDLTR